MDTLQLVALIVFAGVVAAAMLVLRAKRTPAPYLTKTRQTIPLHSIEKLSHDVSCFRFRLPHCDQSFGLPVGKHIQVIGPNRAGHTDGEWNGRPDSEVGQDEVMRKYSPTSDELGFVDLIVKRYDPQSPDVGPFKDGGKISQYIHSLKVGDEMTINGPFGHLAYLGASTFKVGRKELRRSKLGLIAGGVGLTPLLRIVNKVLADPADRTQLWLLFANKTEEDIFLRSELEKLQSQHPEQFRLWYTVDKPPEGKPWGYSTGFISEDMVREHLPSPGPDSVICICGPPPMVKYACKPNLEKVGFDLKQDVVVF